MQVLLKTIFFLVLPALNAQAQGHYAESPQNAAGEYGYWQYLETLKPQIIMLVLGAILGLVGGIIAAWFGFRLTLIREAAARKREGKDRFLNTTALLRAERDACQGNIGDFIMTSVPALRRAVYQSKPFLTDAEWVDFYGAWKQYEQKYYTNPERTEFGVCMDEVKARHNKSPTTIEVLSDILDKLDECAQ